MLGTGWTLPLIYRSVCLLGGFGRESTGRGGRGALFGAAPRLDNPEPEVLRFLRSAMLRMPSAVLSVWGLQ